MAKTHRWSGGQRAGTLYFARISLTRSSGMASIVRPRLVTVVAMKRELYIASSVASMTASNNGDTSSFGNSAGMRTRRALSPLTRDTIAAERRTLGDVENALTKSPDPLDASEPVRARPIIARAA